MITSIFQVQAVISYLLFHLFFQTFPTRTMKTVIVVIISCFCVTFIAAKSCVTFEDCAQDECCYNHQGPLIVSRRQLNGILPLNPITPHEGVCEKFKGEGQYCSVFEQLNGHCGCGKGLHCDFVPASTIATATVAPSKRSVYFPGPGSYMCTRTISSPLAS